MKIVYCANRAIYYLLPTAINSIIQNNKVDKIYLLIEDDSIDYITNSKVSFININNYDFIIREGFNCTRQFPYMAMVRCVISKILSDEDRIIYLDVDTIVDGPIYDLWNFNMGACPIAGRVEQEDYINSGVLLMNLKHIRACKYDEQLIDLLKRCRFSFPDQDAINIVYKNRIAHLPSKFNVIGRDIVYDNEEDILIRHFAGITKPWNVNASEKDMALYKKYMEVTLV